VLQVGEAAAGQCPRCAGQCPAIEPGSGGGNTPESRVLPKQVVQAATELAALGSFCLVDEVVADGSEDELSVVT